MKRRTGIVCMLIFGSLLAAHIFAGEIVKGGSVVTLSGGVTFVGMLINNPNESFQSKFRVDGGFISIPNNGFSFEDGNLWGIVSVENREPTDGEKKKSVVFKGKEFDVTVDEKGDFSSNLTSFEKAIGGAVEEKFRAFPNLSDRQCIEMVAKENNLSPIITTMIHGKAAVATGGRLETSQSNTEKELDQEKAFGDLVFGDDHMTVLTKLQKDKNLDVSDSSMGINASMMVGDDKFFIKPEFYQNKLYQVSIRTLTFNYWGQSFFFTENPATVKSGWESLIKLIFPRKSGHNEELVLV